MLVFPQETSEQLRRRMLDLCQDHVRKALDCVREVCMMIAAYQNGDEIQVFQRYNNVIKLSEEAAEMKRAVMREAAEVGAVLLSRDDFIRLSSGVNTVADFSEGVGYRIAELAKRKWEVNNDIAKDIGSLAEAVLDCILRLRETVLALTFGGSKVFESAKNVESSERIIDTIYRKIDLKIISSNMKLPQIFLIREVAEFLEGMADVADDVNDIVKILAITV